MEPTTLRHRRTAKDDESTKDEQVLGKVVGEDNGDRGSVTPGSSGTSSASGPISPLQWFNVFVPPSLRKAQEHFVRGPCACTHQSCR